MHLVLGLGNPGLRYVDTRHNVGFLVADVLARRAATSIDREHAGALTARCMVAGEQAVLAKPQKFMNLSGAPGQALKDFYKVELPHVIVVHDDLDLPFADVRIKLGGGHGGHNGLRDLIVHMGAGFVRVRVGVGRPPPGWDTADYVLGRWTSEEAASVGELTERAADATSLVVREGLARATQTVHSARTGAPGGRNSRTN
jgi:PTH1 family peptidyl-tRNA hydrolase